MAIGAHMRHISLQGGLHSGLETSNDTLSWLASNANNSMSLNRLKTENDLNPALIVDV